jgi:hypothetical protein
VTINPSDAVYALLSFFIMPPLVSFLTAHNASGAVKGLVVSLLSIGSGIGITLLQGDFNPADASKTILIIVVSAAASYKLILHDFADTFGAIGPQLGKPKDTYPVPGPVENKKEGV